VKLSNPPTLDQVADAMLYLGPSATLTRSVPTADHLSPDFPAEYPQTALSGMYREAGKNQCQRHNS